MRINLHVIIYGKVQGVWFRANTKEKADQLGLNGWVRNTSDGNVEAVFEGEKESVDKILKWCRNGPPLAKVLDFVVKEKKDAKGLDGFVIRY